MTLQKNNTAVKTVRWLANFFTGLQNFSNRLTPAPFRLLQIGSLFWQSRALYIATRLDVATVLGDNTLSVDDLANKLGCNTEYLYRLLRMLASIDIFNETSPRCFKNSSLSSYLMDHNTTVRSMILMHNSPEMSSPWFETMENGISQGRAPFEIKHGVELFEYMNLNREFDELFSSAMNEVEAIGSNSFATDFNWSFFDRLIDLGGSNGSKAISILKHNPEIKAVVVDRDHVISKANSYWQEKEETSVVSRLSFKSGDITEAIPPSENNKDIYFLCGVLHAFNDEFSNRILSRISEQCQQTGAKLAVMDLIVPSENADFLSCSFDIQMLMGTSGLERTLEQWESLFSANSLVIEEVVKLRPFGNIMLVESK